MINITVTYQCNDGEDNDDPADGLIDYPEDPGCTDPTDDNEFNETPNFPPSITLNGSNPYTLTVGDSYVEPGATASDAEDGDISGSIVIGGDLVDSDTVGTYTVTYDVSDSDGAAAAQVTRTVQVNALPPECADGADNDGDSLIDGDDLGCIDENDNDENDAPVITLNGASSITLTLGETYSEAGATADDAEDGNDIPVTDISGSVDTNSVGTYTVHYNFTDSDGVAAAEVTRTVQVQTVCSDGEDNDDDGNIDEEDSGCDSSEDGDENSAPTISLLGDAEVHVTIGNSYTDAGATADDEEDGDITEAIITESDVNTNILGTYTVTYNVEDSEGVDATTVTRTVHVNPVITECNDGINNDGDDNIDENDTGCLSSEDNDENTAPVITLIGSASVSMNAGEDYTDAGATAQDEEDGDITPNISTVNPVNDDIEGLYVITYNVMDSENEAAAEVTRTVTVGPALPLCSNDRDDDEDGVSDENDPGCWSTPNDSGSYDPEDNDETDPLGSITIDKEVVGEGANPDQIFSFGTWLNDATFMSANSEPVTFNDLSVRENGYFISEFNLPSRWSLESIACTDVTNPQAPEVENVTQEETGVRINLSIGEKVDCTFTNRFTPSDSSSNSEHIVIKKIVTDGSDTTQTFSFDVSWSETDVTLIHNTEHVSEDLNTETPYSITEGELPGGWNLINLGCVSSDTERPTFDNPEVPFTLSDGETITCTYTNDQDRYIIFGSIWEDVDGDSEFDEGEAGLSGRTVRATNQNDESEVIVSQSDANGNWELNVPQGTWLVTQDVPSGWEHTGEQSYVVTVPGPEHETFVEEEEQGLIARIMNFFVPTAYAAIIQPSVGPLNFGNKLIPVNTGGGGGGGGGGSSSGSKKVTQQAPVGEVLGAATSVIPQGAPNTGGGGTSPLAVDLPILRAIIAAAGSVVRKTKKNARIS